MKKMLKIAMAMMMVFALSGCGGKSSDKTTLLIGISPDYPPYESLENNKMVGFDIDMTEELIKIMNDNGGNYAYEFKQMSFDTISASIISDQIDLGISGFTYHKDWEVEWSTKYNNSKQVALVAKNSAIKTVADLKGKTLGAQLASTGETAAGDVEEATVKPVKDVKILIETLNSGGIDAVILDEAVAKNYVKQAGFRMLDESLLEEENLILAKKGNTDLIKDVNKALETFIKSDKYQELKDKWGA